ncbi:MAG: YihY/virulence factor BrkB family protein [Alphaproteobacteria bacterium]|nr:YihY/virulence factor BrkB family protein [Alphaproteobacteria bacterium]
MSRGRSAAYPTEIPFSGWKDIGWRIYKQIGEDRVMLIAAGVTFYLLLALVPAMTATLSIYGLFADRSAMIDHANSLRGFIPDAAMEIIGGQLQRLAAQQSSSLGLAFGASLAVALWTTNAGVKALFAAMNVAYDEEEKRSYLKLTGISLLFTLATICGLIGLIALTVLIPFVIEMAGLSGFGEILGKLATYAVALVVTVTGVAALYRFGPSRSNARWQWLSVGSVIAIAVLVVASTAFSWYVANFKSYNATYGSLGAIIGFMTWIWISVIILIIGAEINAETEHQTMVDSTTGEPKPMGQRGAVMADTVGRSFSGEGPEPGDRG